MRPTSCGRQGILSKGTKRQGFTLIEAMVSAVLLIVGITAVIGAYTSMGRNQRIAIEKEQMQRLALDKYQELVATEALQTQSLNGDFTDRGDNNHLWTAAVAATGTDNLSALTVTVSPRNGADTDQAVVNGIVYQPPQTTNGTGTTGGLTGGG